MLYWCFSLPINFVYKYEVSKELSDAIIRKEKIENLLKSEDVMREKMIAQITEQALLQMPEVLVMVDNIKLID